MSAKGREIIMQPSYFETTDRYLEKFLYVHKIRFVKQATSMDRKTKWLYVVNDALHRVLDEYNHIYPESRTSSP